MKSSNSRNYLVAIPFVLFAWLFQALAGPNFGQVFAFVPFLFATILVSWFGGSRGTFLSATLGYLIITYFYVTPGSFLISGKDNFASLTVYVGLSISSGLLAEFFHGSRREAEALAERLQVIFQSMGDAVVVTDRAGLITQMNPVATQLTGWDVEDALGETVQNVFRIRDERTNEVLEGPVTRALGGNAVTEMTNQAVLERRDGASLPIEDSAAPVRDAQGKILGAVLVFRDATEKRRAAAALKESERHLRRVAMKSPVGIFQTDASGDCLFVNDRWCDIAGISRDAAFGRGWSSAIHPADRQRVSHEWYSAAKSGRRFVSEFRFLQPLNEIRWVDSRAEAIVDDAGALVGYLGAVTDVTEQRRAEEALRASERTAQERLALLDHVYDTAPVGLGLVDRKLRYIRINKQLAAMDGRTPEECLGRPLRELLPDLADRIEPLYRTVLETGEPILSHEVRGKTPANPLEDHHWLANYYPVLDPEGVIVGVSSVIIDITHRKRAEEALQDADRRKNEFLAMLAHELRNPLATIRYATNLSRVPGITTDDFNWSNVIDRQVQHLARLVDDLLDVSRITQGQIRLQRESIDATTIIRRAVESLRPLFDDRRHHMVAEIPNEPLPIYADPTRMEQVIQNLLNNAAKYTDPGGEIKIVASPVRGEAVITVTDTGVGMPVELVPRVFDLFTQGERTLDRSQGGLGIGLTLVRQIVEMHGGMVTASSAGIGFGSTFTVRVPLMDRPAEIFEPVRVTKIPTESRRVLVVEDNHDGAQTLKLLLQSAGHSVAVCHDGCEALEAARSFMPDVVLLDIGLPGKDGYQVARELRGDQKLRGSYIVALSGYGQEGDRERTQAAGFDCHLVKPVDFATLRSAIQRQAE